MRPVFVFPGQRSADPGMIRRASCLHPAARRILERAGAVLGDEGLRPYVDPAGVRLDSTRDVQVSVFLATQMHLAALQAEGAAAPLSLGLSVGEYSHLVHIGALAFEDALRLVAARGAAHETSPPGIMVAVAGADRSRIEAAVAAARAAGAVFVSNYDAPSQHVIAGERRAVERAAAALADEHGARTMETESRVPMHTPMLADVAARFRPHLESAAWRTPWAPYVPNVTGRACERARASDLVESLTRHVTHPVFWQHSISRALAAGDEPFFVEVGPGQMVHDMLCRHWPGARHACTDDPGGSSARCFRSALESFSRRA